MKAAFPVTLGVAALGILGALGLVFEYAPIEASMGVVQKIFYFHVSSAWACYMGFLICCGGSVVYLVNPRKERADLLAFAGAEVGLLFGLVVLTTGPIWARPVWGVWWKWDPRLTSMALIQMIFAAYWVLRRYGGMGEGVRRFAASVAVFGTPAIWFVHTAVEKWRGQHPTVISEKGGGLAPEMKTTLLVTALAVMVLFAVLTRLRYTTLVDQRRLQLLRRRLGRLGGIG